MSIITLITDFGTDDEYAGIMKGVILSINPSVNIIDVTHGIDPQDLIHAAYIIQYSYSYFPEGTVHVIVVDPTVGSDRSIISLEAMGHFFIAPDNGVLKFIIDEGNVDSIIHVNNARFFLEPVSRTFHGRDIFAPVSAHLSMGVQINELGTPLEQKNLADLSIPKPNFSDKGELTGLIVSIDRFGNLITNIDKAVIDKFYNSDMGKKLEIIVGRRKIRGLSPNYNSVKPNCPIAVIGSRRYLEIAVNCGSAKNHFMVEKGDTIRVNTEK